MKINIWEFINWRILVLMVFCLPLLTMIFSLPFFKSLSKNARESVIIFGFFGFAANAVMAVETAYRTIASLLDYRLQKPRLVYNDKLGFVNKYEPFDYMPLIYLAVFVTTSVAIWVLIDICSTIKKTGHWGKRYSQKNPLNLNR